MYYVVLHLVQGSPSPGESSTKTAQASPFLVGSWTFLVYSFSIHPSAFSLYSVRQGKALGSWGPLPSEICGVRNPEKRFRHSIRFSKPLPSSRAPRRMMDALHRSVVTARYSTLLVFNILLRIQSRQAMVPGLASLLAGNCTVASCLFDTEKPMTDSNHHVLAVLYLR